MAYGQNTITSPNAANDLALVLDGLLIAAGWTVVESLTPSGTYRAKVYKSAGTLNAAGYDWYTALKWNSIGTEQQMELICGGAYDVALHQIQQPAGMDSGTGAGSNIYAETITGALSGPYSINTATDLSTTYNSHGQGNIKTWWANIVPSSAFAYWASVTLDHVSLFTTIIVLSSGTAHYLAATLDVAASWLAQPYPIATNPVVSYSKQKSGMSATLIGVTPGSINPRNTPTSNIGVALPILDGEYLPAYAWRDAWYSTGVTAIAAAIPPFDYPAMGDGIHIGDAIDYYRVYSGSIGDTVTIGGATYVLSGVVKPATVPVTNAGIDNATYLAVLVE